MKPKKTLKGGRFLTLKIARLTKKIFSAQYWAETTADRVIWANGRTIIHPKPITAAIKQIAQVHWKEMVKDPLARKLFDQAMVMCTADNERDHYLDTASLLGIFRTISTRVAGIETMEQCPRMGWRQSSDAATWQKFCSLIVVIPAEHMAAKYDLLYALHSLLNFVQHDLVRSEVVLNSPTLEAMSVSIQDQLSSAKEEGAQNHFEDQLDQWVWQQFIEKLMVLPPSFDRRAWLNCLLILLKAFKNDFVFLKMPPHGPKYYIWKGKRYKRVKRM